MGRSVPGNRSETMVGYSGAVRQGGGFDAASCFEWGDWFGCDECFGC